MPNTNPLTTGATELADKVLRGTDRMHCDFAFWVGGTHDNVKDIPELERLPGAAGIKVFMGSLDGISSGRRRRRRPHSPAPRAGAPPSTRKTNTVSTSARICASRAIRTRIMWARRDGCAAMHAAFGVSRDKRARSTRCTSRPARRSNFWRAKDVASVEVTPHHPHAVFR